MKNAPASKNKRVNAHYEGGRLTAAVTGIILKHRRLIVVLILAVTLAALFPLRHLKFRNTVTEWLPRDDAVMNLFLETGHTFGMNQIVFIVLKAKDGETFSREILYGMKNAMEELDLRAEVFLTSSIINAPDIRGEDDSLIVADFLADIPDDPAVLETKKQEAAADGNFADTFISRDGRWLSMAVFIRSGEDSTEAFAGVVRPIVEKHLGALAELYYSGEPSTTYYMETYIRKDIRHLVPLVVLLVLLTLFVSFGTRRGVLFPSLTVLFSTAWVFGLMGLFGIPLNMITPALPVLLIALGSAYGIHIVNALSLTQVGAENRDAEIAAGFRRIAVPVLMAGLTTILGFSSFLTAGLKLIMQFGALAALGILFASVIALTFIPAFYGILPPPKTRARERPGFVSFRFLETVAAFVIRRKRVVWLASAGVLVFAVLWIPRISREVDFARYFPPDSSPRRSIAIVREHFDGAFPLTVYFRAENVRSAAALRVMRRTGHFLTGFDRTGIPMGVSNALQELNFHLNDRYVLPDTDGGAANLWFFLEGRPETRQMITDDLREALLFTKVDTLEMSVQKDLEARLAAFLSREKARGYAAFRVGEMEEETAAVFRKKEARAVLEEIEWLHSRYGGNAVLDAAAAARRLDFVIDEGPRPEDPEVLELIREEFQRAVFSPGFEFVLDEAEARYVFAELTAAVGRGRASEEDLKDVLIRTIADARIDEDLAGDAAFGLRLRVEESRQSVFAGRAFRAIEDLFDPEARGHPEFARKVRGLLLDVADGLAVLPGDRVPDLGISGSPVDFLQVEQSGLTSAFTRLDRFLFSSQVQSLILALGMVFLLMVFLRRSVFLGTLSILPILFTLGVIYGFLGFSGIPLDYATMMIAGVSIGVGIDYTIHFVHGVLEGTARGLETEEAVRRAVIEKGRAIIVNSASVVLGFAVLQFSSMSPLRSFGGLMVGAMILAAVAALTILPAMILEFKSKKIFSSGGLS